MTTRRALHTIRPALSISSISPVSSLSPRSSLSSMSLLGNVENQSRPVKSQPFLQMNSLPEFHRTSATQGARQPETRLQEDGQTRTHDHLLRMATSATTYCDVAVECWVEDGNQADEYTAFTNPELRDECETLDAYRTPVSRECDEPLLDATLGGRKSQVPLLYPIKIGQCLDDGRYQVLHRLGCGSYSTVWMAKDTKGAEHAEVVALKVIANGHGIGTTSDVGDMEYQVHELIKTSKIEKSHLLLSQDTFTLRGPRGDHRVLVLPLAGPTVVFSSTIKAESFYLDRPLKYRMSAAKQLLEAVNSLHQAGLVHNDISLSNIRRQIKPAFIQKLVHNPETIGELDKIGFKTRWKDRDGKSITASGDWVWPASFPPESLSDKIFLSGFGSTVKAATSVPRRTHGVAELNFFEDLNFLPPERFHGYNPSPESDVWSFMVFFNFLYEGNFLFCGHNPAQVMRAMVDSLGQLPSEWATSKPESFRSEWYTGAGSSEFPKLDMSFPSRLRRDLERCAFVNRGIAIAQEIELKRRAAPHVLKLMNKVFRFKPPKRIKASELLEDLDWKMLMKIWGVDGGNPGK